MIKLTPVAFFDLPVELDASDTTIPGVGSLPVQVVASLADTSRAIHWQDGTGRMIGLYVGSPGNEVLACTIGGGDSSGVDCYIPVGSRISLKSTSAGAITSGSIVVQFLGLTKH